MLKMLKTIMDHMNIGSNVTILNTTFSLSTEWGLFETTRSIGPITVLLWGLENRMIMEKREREELQFYFNWKGLFVWSSLLILLFSFFLWVVCTYFLGALLLAFWYGWGLILSLSLTPLAKSGWVDIRVVEDLWEVLSIFLLSIGVLAFTYSYSHGHDWGGGLLFYLYYRGVY